MFLETLKISNFRSFEDETIFFEKDLTILVGENNGGKSNVIDALRLITTPLGGRREIYCESTDIRFGSSEPKFEISATFSDLSAPQQGRLISAVTDHTLEKATFGLSYDETKKNAPVRPTIWAGNLKAPPEPGCQETIRHVYLPPLRDAKRALASGNPTRIYALLRHFLGEQDPKELANRLKRDADEKILEDIGDAVDFLLIALTGGVRRQVSSLGFNTDEGLIDIARDLRFKLADHGIDPEDLRYTGHGYANLLYVATIAVELERIKNADLTLFLVEEPEAHLHPQLQAAVLCFLQEHAEKSNAVSVDRKAPAGQLQVIVATHSPNLSAWIPSNNLVFFRSVHTAAKSEEPVVKANETELVMAASAVAGANVKPAIAATEEAVSTHLVQEGESVVPQSEVSLIGNLKTAAVEPPVSVAPRRATRCIPLSKLSLSESQRRKIDRYLDVTKSALLFGGRVLLAEGIAEALLLPVIAQKYVLKGNQEQFRIFRSAVFVPIDGVDFECYVRLLLTPYNEIRIAERLVVITDGDRKNQEPGVVTPGERRKADYEKIAADLGASQILDVLINTYSLETELVNAGNAALMKEVYLEIHPNSEAKWDEAVGFTGDKKAEAIQTLFKDTPKGDFAQLFADAIAKTSSFNVPVYLKSAVEILVK